VGGGGKGNEIAALKTGALVENDRGQERKKEKDHKRGPPPPAPGKKDKGGGEKRGSELSREKERTRGGETIQRGVGEKKVRGELFRAKKRDRQRGAPVRRKMPRVNRRERGRGVFGQNL